MDNQERQPYKDLQAAEYQAILQNNPLLSNFLQTPSLDALCEDKKTGLLLYQLQGRITNTLKMSDIESEYFDEEDEVSLLLVYLGFESGSLRDMQTMKPLIMQQLYFLDIFSLDDRADSYVEESVAFGIRLRDKEQQTLNQFNSLLGEIPMEFNL